MISQISLSKTDTNTLSRNIKNQPTPLTDADPADADAEWCGSSNPGAACGLGRSPMSAEEAPLLSAPMDDGRAPPRGDSHGEAPEPRAPAATLLAATEWTQRIELEAISEVIVASYSIELRALQCAVNWEAQRERQCHEQVVAASAPSAGGGAATSRARLAAGRSVASAAIGKGTDASLDSTKAAHQALSAMGMERHAEANAKGVHFSARPGLTVEQVQHAAVGAALRRDGFAVVRRCVDGGALRALADEYEAKVLPHKHAADVRREVHGEPGEDGLGRVVHVANMHEMPSLAHLAADSRLLEVASACLGGKRVRPVINTELFDKPPNGNSSTTTPPHQDNFYFGAKEPGVALWINLDEVDRDAGTVRFVRGSHLKGRRFHEWDWGPAGFVKSIYDFTDEDEEGLSEVGCLSPGDVVVHSALTIHYAPSNMTPGRRRGLVVNYVAEDVAYTLADDLHKPSLVFRIHHDTRLLAPVPEGWHERHALAVTCVRCALAFEGVRGEVRLDGDVGKLAVEVAEPRDLRRAADALIRSGHVVRGLQALLALPLQLDGALEVPPEPAASSAGARLPDGLVGAWLLSCAEGGATRLALRLQARCGLYADVRVPSFGLDVASLDVDKAQDMELLAQLLAAQRASAGSVRVHEGSGEVVVRHDWARMHPSSGRPQVVRVRQGGGQGRGLSEALLSGLDPAENCTESWQPAEPGCPAGYSAAVLELLDCPRGRRGLWIVMGTWFARVVGRRADEALSDVACRSLAHAVQNYTEAWGMDIPAAVHGCEAEVGRVEAPGVLRVLHGFNFDGPGARTDDHLLLDGVARQLRRDAADDSVLVESHSGVRWMVRELSHSFSGFGQLKRAARPLPRARWPARGAALRPGARALAAGAACLGGLLGLGERAALPAAAPSSLRRRCGPPPGSLGAPCGRARGGARGAAACAALSGEFGTVERTREVLEARGWPAERRASVGPNGSTNFLGRAGGGGEGKPPVMLDVRSPVEFARGHIPGAVNLPLLSDSDREEVGTLHRWSSGQAAFDLALSRAHPRLEALLRRAEELCDRGPSAPHALVYCKRGGRRSQSFAMLLAHHGIEAYTLDAGYTAFRNWAMDVLERPQKLCALAGATGSGKTEVLGELRGLGAQTIDLEALACHKGSVFGHLGEPSQPSSEHLRNLIACEWAKLDPDRFVFLEDEGSRIGDAHLPASLFRRLRAAPLVVQLDVPFALRAERSLATYGPYGPDALAEAVQHFRKKMGSDRTQELLDHLSRGELRPVCEEALRNYDRAYDYFLRKGRNRSAIVAVPVESLDRALPPRGRPGVRARRGRGAARGDEDVAGRGAAPLRRVLGARGGRAERRRRRPDGRAAVAAGPRRGRAGAGLEATAPPALWQPRARRGGRSAEVRRPGRRRLVGPTRCK
ncbi:unnamed protein product, partial [Prorocentrum cordatum]